MIEAPRTVDIRDWLARPSFFSCACAIGTFRATS
ncbi:MAG: hypothetical protein AVDCRST_MAG55-1386 [uncultured Rubrobacteraceae bacterium]|uniref:Uncharacterized protein n=1 Tax=uncultured Rubrobacteraceae bacterium TaxID=349277 RepID=A0A6J4PIU8_9ACTN|nr:MAG: hypothetical protein AVDCRST_MAG55-1386 [uncultured Rubrobacteraceae bacterium]